MKLITIIVVSLFSLSCFAQEVEITNPIPNGSQDYPTSNRIRKNGPVAGFKIYFEYHNTDENEQGVCKALGYERALLNSSERSFLALSRVVKVNSNGKAVSLKSHKRRITKITCINFISPVEEKVFFFWRPSYPNLPKGRSICLSKKVREDKKYGDIACRKLGYKRSLYTQRESAHMDSSCMTVDQNENYLQRWIRPHIGHLACIK